MFIITKTQNVTYADQKIPIHGETSSHTEATAAVCVIYMGVVATLCSWEKQTPRKNIKLGFCSKPSVTDPYPVAHG